MRVALISMVERTGSEPGALARASLPFGGRTIAERQLDFALAWGAERIVCLAAGLDPKVMELQHAAEGEGARFNLVSGAPAMLGLVAAEDELLVLADGLLPLSHRALELLEQGRTVLLLEAEAGAAAGFERVDLNHAWAGALAVPGALVERLGALPPDIEPVSALLRIALQARIPERLLPEAVLGSGSWSLAGGAGQMAQREAAWLGAQLPPVSGFAPGSWLAHGVVASTGANLLRRGTRPALLGIAGGVLAAGGVIAAWQLWPAAGLLLAGLGWLAGGAAGGLRAIARAGIRRKEGPAWPWVALGWGIDAAFVAILAFASPLPVPQALFAPLVLLGLLRISPRLVKGAPAAALTDRALLAVILAIAAAAGGLSATVEVLAILLLALFLAPLAS
ncbi:MAG TPA: hypothetical protein VL100_11950 [Croceibacterium sp.]|nr:hypothetical protein [Croceibacterium sp.]